MVVLIAILTVVGVLALIIPISLYFAWAASHLWLWFIVPVFGAPPLSILQLWGICLFLGMLRPKFDMSKSEEKNWAGGVAAIILSPPLALGMGYAIKNWWM